MKKTILIKISGESLRDSDCNLSIDKLNDLARQIKIIIKKYNVGIVLGGGNILRGAKICNRYLTRVTSDQMGMLSTSINSLALRDVLANNGIDVELLSLIPMPTICKTYMPGEVKNILTSNKVIIFSGGTGNPFFSTDTGIALRILETNSSIVLMGKNGVDGVYSADPKINKNAKHYNNISFDNILKYNLKVMDLTATSLLTNSKVEMYVFNADRKNSLIDALNKKIPITIISRKGK